MTPGRLLPLVVAAAVVACGLSSGPSDNDGGGWAMNDDFALQHNLRLAALRDDLEREVFAQIEAALPRTIDRDERDCETRAASTGRDALEVDWVPIGARDTKLPPNPRNDRIWSVLVGLESTFSGSGPVLARVAFVSQAEGDRWATPVRLGEPVPTPLPDQDDCTSVYEFPPDTAVRLVDAITEPTE